MTVVIINCFDTYEHRVDLLYACLKNQGNDVTVYTSDFRHIEKTKRNDLKENVIYVPALSYEKNLSIKRLISHYQFAADVFEKLERKKIDLLWVLIPPNSLVKAAAVYKRRHANVKLVFDVIDMWPETMPIKNEKFLPMKIWKNIRDNDIATADFVVTECDLYQKKLISFISKNRMQTIYLAKNMERIEKAPNLPTDRIVLCYLGSINNIIDILEIERIIRAFTTVKRTDLHIIGNGERQKELVNAAALAGANVIFHGSVYDTKKKNKIFNQCHYGLNIMKESVYVGLTMKSMDYFAAGLPIINNIKGDTWSFVADWRIGYNVPDISDISKLINYDFQMRDRVREFFEKTLSIQAFEEKINEVMRCI